MLFFTLAFLFVALPAVLSERCTRDLSSQKAGECSASNGYLVYFDFSKCHDSKNWKPQALAHIPCGVEVFGSLSDAFPNTVCISENDFDGYLFIDTGKNNSEVQSIGLQLHGNMSQENPGIAYVSSRPDDAAGHIGQKPAKPIIGMARE